MSHILLCLCMSSNFYGIPGMVILHWWMPYFCFLLLMEVESCSGRLLSYLQIRMIYSRPFVHLAGVGLEWSSLQEQPALLFRPALTRVTTKCSEWLLWATRLPGWLEVEWLPSYISPGTVELTTLVSFFAWLCGISLYVFTAYCRAKTQEDHKQISAILYRKNNLLSWTLPHQFQSSSPPR